MAHEMPFNGFPKECVKFLTALAKHNSKPWFEAHREEYENFVMQPAQQFVVAKGQ